LKNQDRFLNIDPEMTSPTSLDSPFDSDRRSVPGGIGGSNFGPGSPVWILLGAL